MRRMEQFAMNSFLFRYYSYVYSYTTHVQSYIKTITLIHYCLTTALHCTHTHIRLEILFWKSLITRLFLWHNGTTFYCAYVALLYCVWICMVVCHMMCGVEVSLYWFQWKTLCIQTHYRRERHWNKLKGLQRNLFYGSLCGTSSPQNSKRSYLMVLRIKNGKSVKIFQFCIKNHDISSLRKQQTQVDVSYLSYRCKAVRKIYTKTFINVLLLERGNFSFHVKYRQ